MSQQLKMLSVNKTVVFYSPIEGEDVLVRTGTIGEGSCFIAGTRIYTTNGIKNIENVQIGDEVVTHTGNFKKVLQLHKNHLSGRNIHELNVYKSPTIKVTDNHRFYVVQKKGVNNYTKPEWIPVSELNNKSYVMIPNQNQNITTNKLDLSDYIDNLLYDDDTCKYKYTFDNTQINLKTVDKESKHCNRFWNLDQDFLTFLGIWYGNGSIILSNEINSTQLKGIKIVSSQKNVELIKFIKEYGEKIFEVAPSIYTNKILTTITFNNVIVVNIFNHLFGNRFDGKRLPTFIYKVSPDLIKSFIAGIISSTGYIDTKLNISLALTNISLIEELYHVFRSKGIDCSVSYKKNISCKIHFGFIDFEKSNLDVDNIRKYYLDDRISRLRLYKTKSDNTEKTLRLYNNTFLNVTSNQISNITPEFVYTLGIEDDHSYAVEGLIVENCFFHSLLHAYSKNYVNMNNKERMKFVHSLRSNMASNIDKENWETLGNGLIAKIPFQENVHEILINFYKFITQDSPNIQPYTKNIIKKLIVDKDDKAIKLYKLITEIIPVSKFEQNILPDAYTECEDGLIKQCKESIIVKSAEFVIDTLKNKDVEKKRIKYITEEVVKFIHIVVEEAELSAYKSYTLSLQNVSEEVDSYTIGLISDKFDRDIYFLDSRSRMPYMTADTQNIKGRKSLIVMWIQENHYEIVGRLLPGNRIQREFNINDNLIQKLNAFVCNPEIISVKFPELISYLPKEHRSNVSSSHIQSEKEQSSSSSDEDEDEDTSDEDD
jgi:hypothetical protein